MGKRMDWAVLSINNVSVENVTGVYIGLFLFISRVLDKSQLLVGTYES